MKFEIKSRWTNKVLFAVETETLKLAVELGVKNGANLRGADLRGADLRGADLRGAYLGGADLGVAKGLEKFPIQVSGHKHWLTTTPDGELQVGCHKHSFAYWRERADAIGRAEGYTTRDIEIYKLHIEHLAKVSALLWANDEEKIEVKP